MFWFGKSFIVVNGWAVWYISIIWKLTHLSTQIYAFLTYKGSSNEQMTCVGHSLGAHICGMVSNHLTSKQHKIIGMTAFSQYFNWQSCHKRATSFDHFWKISLHRIIVFEAVVDTMWYSIIYISYERWQCKFSNIVARVGQRGEYLFSDDPKWKMRWFTFWYILHRLEMHSGELQWIWIYLAPNMELGIFVHLPKIQKYM